ncbi:hypothetical protein H311_00853, partial [Anncaliia algerae PRA109]
MIEDYIGSNKFREILSQYLKDYNRRFVVYKDFLRYFDEDVSKIFLNFLSKRGFPIIKVQENKLIVEKLTYNQSYSHTNKSNLNNSGIENSNYNINTINNNTINEDSYSNNTSNNLNNRNNNPNDRNNNPNDINSNPNGTSNNLNNTSNNPNDTSINLIQYDSDNEWTVPVKINWLDGNQEYILVNKQVVLRENNSKFIVNSGSSGLFITQYPMDHLLRILKNNLSDKDKITIINDNYFLVLLNKITIKEYLQILVHFYDSNYEILKEIFYRVNLLKEFFSEEKSFTHFIGFMVKDRLSVNITYEYNGDLRN